MLDSSAGSVYVLQRRLKIISASREFGSGGHEIAENLANMQFDYLKKMASEGKSFVIVGRCSETILL